jgi:hypothetical protein
MLIGLVCEIPACAFPAFAGTIGNLVQVHRHVCVAYNDPIGAFAFSGFNNLSNYPVITHSFRHSLTHSVIEFVFVILSPGSSSLRSNDGEFSSGS